jgi:hypothetical protein
VLSCSRLSWCAVELTGVPIVERAPFGVVPQASAYVGDAQSYVDAGNQGEYFTQLAFQATLSSVPFAGITSLETLSSTYQLPGSALAAQFHVSAYMSKFCNVTDMTWIVDTRAVYTSPVAWTFDAGWRAQTQTLFPGADVKTTVEARHPPSMKLLSSLTSHPFSVPPVRVGLKSKRPWQLWRLWRLGWHSHRELNGPLQQLCKQNQRHRCCCKQRSRNTGDSLPAGQLAL